MSMQVIKLGKTNWVAGLSWRSYEDKPVLTEIKEDAAQFNASHYAVRMGASAIQCGFGLPNADSKLTNTYSLAAMLADSNQEPWLGIFKVAESTWWYIAVRDGHAILPDGDVIGDHEVIYAARERHAGYGDWTYIEGELDDLIERIKAIKAKKTPFKPLKHAGFSPQKIIMTVTGAAILAGGYFYLDHQNQLAIQASLAAVHAEQANTQQAVVVPISPLLTTPNLADWRQSCREAVNQPLSIHGWEFGGAECVEKASAVTWKRGAGATVANRPEGVLIDNDTVVTSTPINVAMGTKDAIDLEGAKIQLIASLQTTGITLQSATTAIVMPLPGSAPAAKPVIITPQLPFSFDTPISVFYLNLNVPGLRLSKINTTANGWHVEGVLYGTP